MRDFTTYNQSGSTLTRPRILRLNIDGTVDTAFSPGSGANNTVRAIRVQANGAILIGGSFTAINGIGRNNLARLLGSNGSLDTTFNIGTGVNGHVFAIAIMPSGNIAFGGSFSRFNTSIVRNGVVILTPTGGVDTDFEPPAGEAQNNENNSVRSLLEQNGKLLVSGWVRVRDKLDRMMWLTDSKNQADMLFTEGGLAGAAFNPNAVVTLSAKNIGKVEQPNDALTTWSYNASTGLISGQFKPDNSGVKRTAKYNALLIPVTPSDVIGLGSFDLIEQPNGTTITSGNALIHTGRVKIAPKP